MRTAKALILAIPMLIGYLPVAAWGQAMVTVPGPGRHMFFISTGGGVPPPLPPVIIPPLMMGMEAAHLSADQKKQMSLILESNRSKTAPLIERLQSIHEKIADKLLAPGAVTASDLAPLEAEAAKLDTQIQDQGLDASLRIRSLLTADQVARMARFHKKMAALQAQMKSLMTEAAQETAPKTKP